ncbi:hypothetical protein HG566_05975 [Helicobacter pylori]|uniref:hypothetical protein n=1 Tax=Helicobacter pylori TaxID=210 RepID=UPI001921A394|nr:hypothetical protein [Helicobacter pylori]QQW88345.1 hypothetical protein HG566_05975 [Helicobacter pylori]WRA90643.1 hypothetical protein E5L41_06100 [Helicobacter pylori]
MKFLAKWYLLFFIALSSLVFVGCDDPGPIHGVAHNLERDYGFSHGVALFIAFIVLWIHLSMRNRRR